MAACGKLLPGHLENSNEGCGDVQPGQVPHGQIVDTHYVENEDEDEDEFFDNEDDDDDDVIFETMDDSPNRIQPGLFIGSFMAEQNKSKLKMGGITHILQVAAGMQPSHPEDFSYMQVQVEDLPQEDLVPHFAKCFAFIDDAMKQQGGVLVHCMAGVSRSSTICIAYIMWKERLGYETAFSRVLAARPWVAPNSGFRAQLTEFERLEWDVTRWDGASFRAQREVPKNQQHSSALLARLVEQAGLEDR